MRTCEKLMATRVSIALKPGEALTVNGVQWAVSGNTRAVRAALEWLVANGYVERTHGSGRALLHTSVKPFRAGTARGDRAKASKGNTIDHIKSGGAAPRLAVGVALLEALPKDGRLWRRSELMEMLLGDTDLMEKTIDNLLWDACHCETPILYRRPVPRGTGDRARYLYERR